MATFTDNLIATISVLAILVGCGLVAWGVYSEQPAYVLLSTPFFVVGVGCWLAWIGNAIYAKLDNVDKILTSKAKGK